jgi:hypothetical protein
MQQLARVRRCCTSKSKPTICERWRRVPSSDALSAARRPSRLYVLRKLIGLQTGPQTETFVPLAAMMDREISIKDLRRALAAGTARTQRYCND